MTWDAFVTAPVTVEQFAEARDLLWKIVRNILDRPEEPKFRKLRPGNAVLSRVLFPQALTVLHFIGFQHDGASDLLELREDAVPALPDWLERLSVAQLMHAVPSSLGEGKKQLEHAVPENLLCFSDFTSAVDILRGRSVCTRWRYEAQAALLQGVLGDLHQLQRELRFDGWFQLSTEFTVGDPVAAFQAELVGKPLSCYAGGAMRLKRPVVQDINVADVAAFHRLNPWEMLKVGRYGLRARPEEPSLEWWATLRALVLCSELRGRQWDWSERSMAGNSLLYARHIIYVLARGATRITVTMRAVWDSSV